MHFTKYKKMKELIFKITQITTKGSHTLPEWFKLFLIHKAENYQLFKDNLEYFTDCSIDEYLEFTHPEDYVSNAFDFTLAMRPYPNYWEDVESEWFEILNNLKNKE